MADYKSTHTGEQIDTAIDNANSNWSLLMANLGIGRWRNQTLIQISSGGTEKMIDSLSPYYTNIISYFAYGSYNGATSNATITTPLQLPDFNLDVVLDSSFFMYGFQSPISEVYLGNGRYSMLDGFAFSNIKKLLVGEGKKAYFYSALFDNWKGCSNLTEIGEIDFSNVSNERFDANRHMFKDVPLLKTINIKNITNNISLYYCVAMEKEDLINVFSNLIDRTGMDSRNIQLSKTQVALFTEDELNEYIVSKNWVILAI